IGPRGALASIALTARGTNWLAEPPGRGESIGVRIRHGAPIVDARVAAVSSEGFSLELETAQDAVTPGQSAVLYREDVVLGGGVITGADRN
ncbi:MAG: hypothetical protein N2B05_08775, partial [Gemmatimonadales bacterium]